MILVAQEAADKMVGFSKVDIGNAALGCIVAGAGKPVVYFTTASNDTPTTFHSLIAQHLKVFIVSLTDADVDASTIGAILKALGLDAATILCRGSVAQAALEFAREAPDAVSQLILIAPQVQVSDALRAVERPVLVLESSRSSDVVSVGQKLTGLMPECYDVLVYDTSDALDTERPEAVADVVADFVDRSGGFIVGKPRGPIHP